MDERIQIYWDGECGLCRRAVSWVRRRDAGQQFEFVPYQEVAWPPMDAQLEQACSKAVHVIRSDGTRLRAGRACLFVLGRLGWPRTTSLLAIPPLVWLVELGYQIVARNRRLFSRVLFRREAT